jgi:hypothetical protein
LLQLHDEEAVLLNYGGLGADGMTRVATAAA